jgi:hypothetical protein
MIRQFILYSAIQCGWAGIGKLCPALVDENLQMDKNFGYRQKDIVFRHKGEYIVNEESALVKS